MILVLTILIAALVTYGIIEVRRHEAQLRLVPVRVHVNGTRGKSSVTRLIAAGMRAGGICTFAKTTGTTARMIYPDGSEVDVYRVGHANVIEQTRVVRRAVEAGAQALVIECMAVRPELQPLSELRLIRSTVGVITNVRADHLDVMGPTVDDAAAVLAQTLPVGGHAFTAERERAHILAAIAKARGSELHVVTPDGVTDADLAGFEYIEHGENVALALAVCSYFGVDRATALGGMYRARPDPGVLVEYTIRSGVKEVRFINAFAANDPDSTLLIWNRLGLDRSEPGLQRIILANCRRDRLQRSEQIADLLARRLEADHVILSGEGTRVVASRAAGRGLDPGKLSDLGGHRADQVYEHVLDLVRHRAVVVGIGNIVGLGEEIVTYFRNREVAVG